jgi:hypothetical protein
MPEYMVISRQILIGTISDLPHFALKAWLAILFEGEKLRGRVKLPVRVLSKMASITSQEAAEAVAGRLAGSDTRIFVARTLGAAEATRLESN